MKIKRIISICMVIVIVCALLPTTVGADYSNENAVISQMRIELDDGYYIIEEIGEYSVSRNARASSSKTGYKNSTYYNANNVAIFGVKVTGSFTYDGTTAKATSSTANVYIYDSSATYVSKSANYSSNFATATGRVKYTSVTIPKTVTLYCSASGVLS